MSERALLDVDRLTMRFGGLVAIDALSFAADREKITAVIGPNGAGKTTVFNCLTGFYRPTSGSLALHRERWRNSYDLILVVVTPQRRQIEQ